MLFPLWVSPTNILSVNEERFIAPEGVMGWATSNVNGRYPVPPGGGFLTQLQVLTPNGAGANGSWTFSYVVNGVEQVATRVKLEGEGNTKGEWKGRIELKAGDTFQIKVVGTGTPSALPEGPSGVALFSWIETVGNLFWIGGGGGGNATTAEAAYNPPYGINSAGWQTSEGLTRVLVPGKYKLKGVAIDLSGTAGAAKSYTLHARINRKEDTLPVKVEGTSATSALAEGSVQLNAGDTWESKIVPAGTPTARTIRYTYAVETEVTGEMFAAGVNESAGSTTAINATWPDTWKSSWLSTVANARLPRPATLKLKRLYVELGTAPGVGKSRNLVLELNGANTELAVKIEGAATAGNDTTHSFTLDGNLLALKTEPSGTPAANTGGTHWGFVVVVPQPFSAALGKSSEADTSRSLARQKARAVGRAGETDTGSSLKKSKARALGKVVDVEVARPLAKVKARLLGKPIETDQISALGKSKARAVGRAIEASQAEALDKAKTRTAGSAIEADGSFSLGETKARALGRAAESDRLGAIGRRKSLALGQAAESDFAEAVFVPKIRLVDPVAETDAALPIRASKVRELQQATEVSEAYALVSIIGGSLGQATELDYAFPLVFRIGHGGTAAVVEESAGGALRTEESAGGAIVEAEPMGSATLSEQQ